MVVTRSAIKHIIRAATIDTVIVFSTLNLLAKEMCHMFIEPYLPGFIVSVEYLYFIGMRVPSAVVGIQLKVSLYTGGIDQQIIVFTHKSKLIEVHIPGQIQHVTRAVTNPPLIIEYHIVLRGVYIIAVVTKPSFQSVIT